MMKNFKVPIPKMNEQLIINKKLESVNNTIKAEQQILTKQTQLKRGLMQDLLTGKVEVAV